MFNKANKQLLIMLLISSKSKTPVHSMKTHKQLETIKILHRMKSRIRIAYFTRKEEYAVASTTSSALVHLWHRLKIVLWLQTRLEMTPEMKMQVEVVLLQEIGVKVPTMVNLIVRWFHG
jgi:hypothetical protein